MVVEEILEGRIFGEIMKLKAQTYSVPGLIFAGLGGILMLYVIYAIITENDTGLTIKVSIISLFLLIISLLIAVKKMHTDKKNMERQIQIQEETLAVHKEQLYILEDIRTERSSKPLENESESNPWAVILILIAIFLVIPIIIIGLYLLFKKD
jgi:hypothetical protein